MDEKPVERPRNTHVVLDRPGDGVLVVRYRNSRGWSARALLFALLWLALAVVPPLFRGWEAYRSVLFLVLLFIASLSLLLQWLVGWLGKARGMGGPLLVAAIAVAACVGLLAAVAHVLRVDTLAKLRPAAIGAIWLVCLASVLRWLGIRYGVGELRVDGERCRRAVHGFTLSRPQQCRTDRVIAIGSGRPRPHLDPNMPRGGLGRLMAWRFEQGPLAGIAAAVCIYAAVRLGSLLPVALVTAYAVLIVSISRTSYPVTILTRRRVVRLGHYLTKEEQAWIAYELRTFMQQIGHPVKRSLYRA